MLRVAVLASGRGTNFVALRDACATGYAEAELVCVLSDRRRARVLERAASLGVEGIFVDPKRSPDREAYDELLLAELEARGIDLACNAGFMRILGRTYCKAMVERALNVHPSLLPAFPGAHGIRDAWEWGVKTSGVTVHFVTEDLDLGPIVCQRAVEVAPGEDRSIFERRIHLAEYAIYPKALKLFAEGRLRVEGRRVVISGDVDDPPWSGGLPPSLGEEEV